MTHSHAFPGVNYVHAEYIFGRIIFFLNNIIYIEENKLKKFAKAGEVSDGLQFISESQIV